MLKISNALRRMAQGELISNHGVGLCTNLLTLEDQGVIDGISADGEDELLDMMQAWPEFSGEEFFPVPGGEALYVNYDVPKWGDDEYGRARKRLCIYLAEKFEEMGR
jgi:hypothetical protein